MYQRQFAKIGSVIFTLFVLALASASAPASAQSDNPLGNILGGVLGSIIQGAAKAEWEKLAPAKLQCMELGLKSQNTSVQTLIQGGVKPSDNRLQPIHQICDSVLGRQLRTNFDCSLPLSTGGTLATKCSEEFVAVIDGNKKKLEPVEAMHVMFNGGNVSVDANITPEALENYNKEAARKVAEEARKKEQQRKVAEAKRLEEEAARKRLAEEAERKRLAFEAERKRLAEEAERKRLEKIAQDTQRTLTDRKQCKPKLEAIGFFKGRLNKGDVAKALSSDISRSSDAYKDALPYILAGAGEYEEVEAALSIRIVNDSKRWRDAAAQKDLNAVADADGAITALRENCYHELADFLVANISLGAAAETEYVLGKSASQAMLNLTIVSLLKTVPAQSLEQTFKERSIRATPRALEAALTLERKRLAEETERKRLAMEAERKRSVEEANRKAREEKRLAEITEHELQKEKEKVERLSISESGIKKSAESINLSLLKTVSNIEINLKKSFPDCNNKHCISLYCAGYLGTRSGGGLFPAGLVETAALATRMAAGRSGMKDNLIDAMQKIGYNAALFDNKEMSYGRGPSGFMGSITNCMEKMSSGFKE